MEIYCREVLSNSGTDVINRDISYQVNNEYRRGLLDILDIHACSGVIQERNVNISSSKDEFPYTPSLKSIPATSTSEESANHNNEISNDSRTTVSVNRTNTYSAEYSNERSFERYIDYNDKTGRGFRNVTSVDTFRIADIIPEQSDESLMDVHSWDETEPGKPYCLMEMSSAKASEEREASQLSVSRRSQKHFNSNLESSDQSLRAIGVTDYRKRRGNFSQFYNSKQFSSSSNRSLSQKGLSPTLRLFDCNKFPLTDGEGNVLLSANDQHLVIFKNGKPTYDCFKRPVYDENGVTSDSVGFQPYGIARLGEKISWEIALYDFRGFPLTDCYGTVLTNADNRKLILIGPDGDLISDLNGHPIFDKSGIPLTKKGEHWLKPEGTPYRVYDNRGFPLTDRLGTPLKTRHGVQLLATDRHGRPVLDCNNEPVFDCQGNIVSDTNFDPSAHQQEHELVVALADNTPLEIYDGQGFPLSTVDGELLKDANGRYLLDVRHKTVNRFNWKYTVLPCKLLNDDNCSAESDEAVTDINRNSVYNRQGKRVVIDLLDKSSSSDTQSNKESSEYANPVKDNNESSEGTVSITDQHESTDRVFVDRYGRPTHDLFLRALYDESGRPISTADGRLLSDGSDESPKTRIDFRLSQTNDSTNFSDLLGRPLYDTNGRPNYNSKGKPVSDVYGRPLYDKDGLPLCNENGLPASLLIKRKNLRIRSVEDRSQRLIVSSRNTDLSADSKIKTRDNIIERGELPKHYNARVRITTFENGEEVLELLKAVPEGDKT